MQMRESGEMYLETILVLSMERGQVRSVDVSEYMGYSKPSVSRAVGLLRRDGYLEMDGDGLLTLTPKGRAVAEKIYGRHVTLKALLMGLGVEESVAAADACKIEHDISDQSFAAIQAHMERYRKQ